MLAVGINNQPVRRLHAIAFQHAILLTNLSANTSTLFITTLNMTM